MNIRYRVELNEGERAQLTAMLSGGKHAGDASLNERKFCWPPTRGSANEAIADSISVGGSTVYRTKRRFVEGNLELALSEEARPGAARQAILQARRRCWWRRSASEPTRRPP